MKIPTAVVLDIALRPGRGMIYSSSSQLFIGSAASLQNLKEATNPTLRLKIQQEIQQLTTARESVKQWFRLLLKTLSRDDNVSCERIPLTDLDCHDAMVTVFLRDCRHKIKQKKYVHENMYILNNLCGIRNDWKKTVEDLIQYCAK